MKKLTRERCFEVLNKYLNAKSGTFGSEVRKKVSLMKRAKRHKMKVN